MSAAKDIAMGSQAERCFRSGGITLFQFIIIALSDTKYFERRIRDSVTNLFLLKKFATSPRAVALRLGQASLVRPLGLEPRTLEVISRKAAILLRSRGKQGLLVGVPGLEPGTAEV